MRIPYIVGRWVTDRNHYGRHRLSSYILYTPDIATWIVGARRMGKTSLLRQLEFLTDHANEELTPLFWDLQGCESSGDLSAELFLAIEDASNRFTTLGIDIFEMEGLDALVILRRLSRKLAASGKRLLLLIDEAEALINIAQKEASWLARLRRTLQDPGMKTVMASTKLLVRLNELTADWPTSPFLFGFNLANLWSLDDEAAIALIEQHQADHRVHVDPATREEIVLHTHRHPYLIQYLCQRLYEEDAGGQGFLRPPTDQDLEPDHLLTGFFLIDFQQMTQIERRILLAVERRALATEQDLLADLADENPQRIRTFLWGMEKLGHIRQLYGQLTIGNEYLRRWLQAERDRLERMNGTLMAEESIEEMLQIGYAREASYHRVEIERIERDYAALHQAIMSSNNGQQLDAINSLERLNQQLTSARRDYDLALQRQRAPLSH